MAAEQVKVSGGSTMVPRSNGPCDGVLTCEEDIDVAMAMAKMTGCADNTRSSGAEAWFLAWIACGPGALGAVTSTEHRGPATAGCLWSAGAPWHGSAVARTWVSWSSRRKA